MALLFTDSFDGYATANFTTKYTSTAGTIAIDGSSGRNSTSGLKYVFSAGLGNTPQVKKTLITSGTTAIVGFAFQASATNSQAYALCKIYDGATEQITLRLNTDQRLAVYRGSESGTLLGTSSVAVSVATFVYLELKVGLSDASGTYEVRINGASILSGTGVDTKNTANATWDGVALGAGANNTMSQVVNILYDDLYICDSSGAQNTDFLGDVRIECLLPQTDAVAAGANAGLTPSTGTDHGALVDESTPNTTDYNSSATPGVKDTYNFPALSSITGVIKGVQIGLYALNSDAGVRTVCPVLRHSGVDYDGTTVSLGTSAEYKLQLYELNPGTGVAFTIADIAALEAGMKVVA